MLKRIITALVATAVFIPVLIFSETWVFPVAMALASLIGCYEMISCIGKKKNLFFLIPIYLASVFFPLSARHAYASNIKFADFAAFAIGITLLLALYIFAIAVFNNQRTSVTDAALIYVACFYIIAAFTAIVYIRDYVPYGGYIYLLAFICAWTTDIFAYFTGRLFGKHKLIESVSPKKTVEGAIGGVVFCVIVLLVFGFVIDNYFDDAGIIKANYGILAISGIFISAVSQVGDLIMSLIKRKYGIKDYGWMFPGHGGILDRFDSVIAVTLILAFICTYFNLFSFV